MSGILPTCAECLYCVSNTLVEHTEDDRLDARAAVGNIQGKVVQTFHVGDSLTVSSLERKLHENWEIRSLIYYPIRCFCKVLNFDG